VIHRAGSSVSVTQNLVPEAQRHFYRRVEHQGLHRAVERVCHAGSRERRGHAAGERAEQRAGDHACGTQDVFFRTTSQVDVATGRILQTTVEPQAITEGVVLSVTPQISGTA